jgi:hypothetical protein
MAVMLAEDEVGGTKIYPLPVSRAPGAPELPAPLTPARDGLRQAITRLAQAQREAEAAAEPLRRCETVQNEDQKLRAELDELYKRDQLHTGEWIAGGRVGPDPGDADDTRALNDRLVAMQGEVRAVAVVLSEKRALHQAAVERVRAAAAERDQARYAVVVEVATSISGEFTTALNEALRFQARIVSLAAALSERGNAGDNAALGAAGQILEVMKAAQRAAGVPPDLAFGRQALDQLAVDPAFAFALDPAPPEPAA